jgi:hypothetical protein
MFEDEDSAKESISNIDNFGDNIDLMTTFTAAK